MDILLSPETLQNIQRVKAKNEAFAAQIKDHPKLKDVRQKGTILVLEWETGGDTSYLSGLRNQLYLYFLERGIILRPLGNIIYILPPYIISNKDLDHIYATITQALNDI